MTQGETLKIMAVLQAAYPNFYRGMTRQDAEGVVALWADIFAEDSYNTVAAAVRAFIASDSKGFPPVVGQIKQRVAELASRTAALLGAVQQVCDKRPHGCGITSTRSASWAVSPAMHGNTG